MDGVLKIRLSSSVPSQSILMLLHGLNIFGLAPQGCWHDDGKAGCNFQRWAPPLLDKDFGTGAVYDFTLNSINGSIPAGAFSGLHGPFTNRDTYIKLRCPTGKTRLSRDIFTPNLDWVIDLLIFNCYLETGLPSRLLENLYSLKYLTIIGSDVVIDGVVAPDTLAGLSNLQRISVNSPVANGKLPPGFFDGLKNLTQINLNYAELNFVPPNWFNGLVSLKKIFLSNNNLQTLPPGLFDDLGSLEYIALYNNQWNCSCELMWLLKWTLKTVGGVCNAPSVVKGRKLEDAFGLLDCTPSTTNILSMSVSSAAKNTKPFHAVSFAGTFMVPSVSSDIPVTTIVTTKSTTAEPTIFTSAVMPEPTATVSSPIFSVDEIGTSEHVLNLSSSSSATVTFVQVYNSTSTRGYCSTNRANNKDVVVADLHKIALCLPLVHLMCFS